MTRKHYIQIADTIVRELAIAKGSKKAVAGITNVAYSLCTMMIADNPAFNKNKFLKACGL